MALLHFISIIVLLAGTVALPYVSISFLNSNYRRPIHGMVCISLGLVQLTTGILMFHAFKKLPSVNFRFIATLQTLVNISDFLYSVSGAICIAIGLLIIRREYHLKLS